MFNVGDLIIGIANNYSHTGKGSICRVIRAYPDRGAVTVEVLKPAPSWCVIGEHHDVEISQFKLKPENEMRVEPLKVYLCQKGYGEVECEEIASHRITIPGLSLTFCEPHAQPYIKGYDVLEAIKCSMCQGICKPRYPISTDYGLPFCSDAHLEAYRTRDQNRQAYASASTY